MPLPSDFSSPLLLLRENPKAVLEALRMGRIESMDAAGDRITDLHVLYALKSGLLAEAAASFPDPRAHPEILSSRLAHRQYRRRLPGRVCPPGDRLCAAFARDPGRVGPQRRLAGSRRGALAPRHRDPSTLSWRHAAQTALPDRGGGSRRRTPSKERVYCVGGTRRWGRPCFATPVGARGSGSGMRPS